MWNLPVDANAQLNQAIEFTGDYRLYGRWMMKVAEIWPNSCENALTDYSLNRKAWIGHAAVALALKIPESVTRKAWGYLNYEQQLLANNQADRAIRVWEYAYRKDKGLCEYVGETLL